MSNIQLTNKEITDFRDKINLFLKSGGPKRINSKLIMANLSNELDHLEKTFKAGEIESIEIINKKLKVNKDAKLPKENNS